MRADVSNARRLGGALALLVMLGALAPLAGCSDNEKTIPSIGFLFPSEGDELTADDDVDAALDGVQIDIQLAVLNFNDAGTLTLQVEGDASTLAQTAVAGEGTYVFGGFTLPEGEVTLVSALLDGDGASQSSARVHVSVTARPPTPPELHIASPAEDGTVLTGDDDVDDDPFNGLQIDVVVEATEVPVGTPIALSLGANPVATLNADAAGAVFTAVTIPVTGPGEVLTLRAEATVADELVSAQRTVAADVACVVEVEPLPSGAACDFSATSADDDPDTAGLQTTLAVHTNCARAEIDVNGDGDSAFVEDGSASFDVTLDEGENAVSASVSDSDPPRSASIGPLTYVVDTVAPTVALTAPVEGAVLFTDRDGNPDNGFQIGVGGTVSGVEVGTEVEVLVDGAVAGTAESTEEGVFFTDLTVTEGTLSLAARASDSCGNTAATEPISVEVVTALPSVSIGAPATDTALLADGDPDGGAYETTFSVSVSDVSSGVDVVVQCRRPTGVFAEAGRATFGGPSPVAVDVTLTNAEWYCRASVTADDVVTTSLPIHLFVDNVAPLVTLIAPEDGSSTADAETTVEAFVTRLSPAGPVTLTVNDGEPTPVELVGGGIVAPVTLEEGDNTLTVTAQEVFDPDGLALPGNTASASVTVTYDTQPPTVSFIAPSSGTVAAGDAHDQYLYDVVVEADEVSASGEVCLQANDAAEVCVTAVASGAAWRAAFADTFLLPGANVLRADVVDDAGNLGTAQLDVAFESTLARLEWVRVEIGEVDVSPVDGAIVAASEGVDLVLQTDQTEGTSLSLRLNGLFAGVALVGAGGEARYTNVLLVDESSPALADTDGWNELQVTLTSDATQRSPLARVRIDTTAPTLAFSTLEDGDTVSLERFSDASPRDGFQLSVGLTLTGVEAGQIVHLQADCNGTAYDASYEAVVGASTVTVLVDVPGEGSCTLTANVSDRAGNPATPAVVDLSIDVSPPTCAFVAPTDGQLIDVTFDEVLGGDIQFDVVVQVGGATGDLTLSSLGGEVGPLALAVPGGGVGNVTFDNVTLPDGDLELTATVADTVGNECEAAISVTVFSPDVTLSFFGLQTGDNLNLSRDTSADAGFQGSFQVIASGAFLGDPVVMCRALAPGGTSCTDPSYEIVGTSSMQGASASFTNVFLPEDDTTTLLAELDLGGTQVQSAPITVCVDTIRPTIDGWTLTNDVGVDVPGFGVVGAGDGFLNLGEAPDRRAQVTLELGGLGGSRTVRVFSSAVTSGPVATGTTTGTFSFTTGALPQGAQTLRAEFSDTCGNAPAATAPTLGLGIDTVPATLAWEFPANGGAVLAADDLSADPGGQVVVSLLSDAFEGAGVVVSGLTLTDPPTEVANVLLVDADGRAAGEASLAEGNASLSATVLDVASNPTTAAASVLVDVTAPTIALTLPGTIEDADQAAPGFQLDLGVATTQAETGQLILFESTATGGQIGTANVGTTSGGDLAWAGTVRLTMPVGAQQVTARVGDTSGNVTESAPVSLTVDVTGCGLVFLNPPGSPVLVDATGYSGSGPKRVNAQLVVLDIAGCASAADPATVRVRIGCDSGADDSACTRVYSTTVATSGQATFTGVDALEFFDGEVTTMHGIVVHPGTGEVSVTEQKDVVVDLLPPVVSLTRPGVLPEEQVLSRRDTILAGDWTRDVNTVVGPLTFTADDAYGTSCAGVPAPRSRCSYTIRYANGTILNDAGGPIQNRAINTAGSVNVSLTGVRYPTLAGTAGTNLEVRVTDEAGNLTVGSLPLNVDVDPPPTPGSFVIDGSPYEAVGGARSGRSDLSWTASTDDAAGGSAVSRYEIRAMCTTRTVQRTLRPGAPVGNCSDLDWSAVNDWESRPLVATVSGGQVTYLLDLIGLDEVWTVGVRAFDEADNWSLGVNEGTIDTTLDRTVVGTYAATAGIGVTGLVSLGDVNDDGFDDLLVTSGDSSVRGGQLILGEESPGTTAALAITAPAPTPDTSFFGSSLAAIGDVNDDGFADFAIASPYISFFTSGNNYIYIYFGGPTDTPQQRTDLVTPDTAVVGPPGRSSELIFSVRSGTGNAFGLTAEDAFDDFFFGSYDYFITEASDAYVVLGRSSWPALGNPIALDGTGADACLDDVIRIAGTNPPDPGLSTGRFGLDGGLGDLDDDGWADAVLGAWYPGGGTSSAQYVYYGGQLTSCPTGWDLSVADEVIENAGGTAGDPASTPVAVDDGTNTFAAGVFRNDWVELYEYDADLGGLALLQTSAITVDRSPIRYGHAVGFGDVDASGSLDLVVGAEATLGGALTAGRVYVAGATDATPRFGTRPDFWMTATGTGKYFGQFTVTGFDYNGDGLTDIAATDQDASRVILFW